MLHETPLPAKSGHTRVVGERPLPLMGVSKLPSSELGGRPSNGNKGGIGTLVPAGAEIEASMVVYPVDTTFLRHRLRDWPQLRGAAEHRQFITDRIQPALEIEGVAVRLVEFDSKAYEGWRGNRGDSDTLRAEWAALQ